MYGLSGITHCVLQDVGYQSRRLSLTLGDGPITPAVYEDLGILSTQQYQPFPEFFFSPRAVRLSIILKSCLSVRVCLCHSEFYVLHLVQLLWVFFGTVFIDVFSAWQRRI